MIEKAEGIEEDTIRRAAEGEGSDGVISSNRNLYQGVLNSSMPQYDDEPKFLVYAHSPGFEEFQEGYVQVKGRVPEEEVPEKIPGQPQTFAADSDVDTDYIKLEVLPEEAMPTKSKYQGSDLPEAVLQHNGVEMREEDNVTFQVYPWTEGQITGSDWQDNIQNYDQGDLSFRGS